MLRVTRVVVMVALVLALGRPAGALDQDEIAAAKQAEAWLILVDQQKYADSWDAAATVFRDTVDRGMWADALGGPGDRSAGSCPVASSPSSRRRRCRAPRMAST